MLRHKLCRHTRVSIMSKRISGKFCVAAGCTSTHRDNVSLHEFPKENRAEIRRLWINFVKTKRNYFTNTSKYSVLCEKHFTPECYPMEYSIKKAMGLEVKKKSKEEMFASSRNTYNPHGRYDAVKKTMYVSITGELYASLATKKKKLGQHLENVNV